MNKALEPSPNLAISQLCPSSQRDLKNIGFHWDLSDHTREILDTRPGAKPGAKRTANVFHWQAAARAESKSITDWIKKNGSHAVIKTIQHKTFVFLHLWQIHYVAYTRH
ncbi:hypothetical protein RJZ56_001747 [Blastomyces dermatitidis]|uniref:Uncharacterized protein n=3 Tax=Blastomyces TaxID=229219 RepID=A0A179UY49_BLAGS|nr:uncharacterized protein BDBG_07454 [Blastomyces gilchristii SLH14081]XP_045276618.1 uncharacterized protein BDCG_04881 [Blastomyces dermatitidis ER-3]EEQ89761.1 hypothetical protein BDCG_04881 [Blastomyces dermatitidis ER-3]EGE80793.1 hypothetical protein BDDG_03734 [Blastomyces dermatitidis ATCC 18188]OAT12058.1 hypothetical protein BDBG_07454 [Blastomyces gilchristii SLH14081]